MLIAVEERERRVFAVIAELGFRSAEIRTLQAQLACACARQDTDVVLDLAEELLLLHARFAEAYRRLLVIGPRRCSGPIGRLDDITRRALSASGHPAEATGH